MPRPLGSSSWRWIPPQSGAADTARLVDSASREDIFSAALELLAFLTARAEAEARRSNPPLVVLRDRLLGATSTAYAALARGDTAGALGHLEAIPDTLCLVGECFHLYLTLARLLAARGDDRRAGALLERWRWAAGSSPWFVLATLERGRVAERLDRKRCPRGTDSGSGESWFEPRRGNSKVRLHFGGSGLFVPAPAAPASATASPLRPPFNGPPGWFGDAIARGSRPGAVSASCRCPETLDEWPARRSSRRRTSGWCPIGSRG